LHRQGHGLDSENAVQIEPIVERRDEEPVDESKLKLLKNQKKKTSVAVLPNTAQGQSRTLAVAPTTQS